MRWTQGADWMTRVESGCGDSLKSFNAPPYSSTLAESASCVITIGLGSHRFAAAATLLLHLHPTKTPSTTSAIFSSDEVSPSFVLRLYLAP